MRQIALLLFLVPVGCGSPSQPSEDVIVLNLLAIGTQTGMERCAEGQALRDCVPLSAPHRTSGIWVRGFEMNLFQPDRRTDGATDFEPDDEMFAQLVSMQKGRELIQQGPEWGSYRVEFIGRRSTVVGQFGRWNRDTLIVVDRMISMREVEPPPKVKE